MLGIIGEVILTNNNIKVMERINMSKTENKSIDLSNVPSSIHGNQIWYHWKNAKGVKCGFEYNSIRGMIQIVDTYEKKYKNGSRLYLIVEYNNKQFHIVASSFAKCQIYNIVFHDNPSFKYNIGQRFIDDKRDFTILDQECREYQSPKGMTKIKYYYVHCNKCGKESWRIESCIEGKAKTGCPVCEGNEVLFGYNDITTTDPWMIKYFQGGFDEAKLYSKASEKELDFICPDCKRIKHAKIRNIYKSHKLSCICQDQMSYPNKFMYSFFNQLGVNFTYEKSFKWSDGKKYDDYIELDNGCTLICENHGAFHYNEKGLDKRSLEERQKNDYYKKELATKNNITYYVELNCIESTKEHIQNSIENSILAELFDLSKIDYDQCDIFAMGNLVKTVCDYKRENPELFVNDISSDLHLNSSSVRKYLKAGSKLGWCEYNPTNEVIRKAKNMKGRSQTAKPIKCIDFDKYYHDAKVFISSYFQEYGEMVDYNSILDTCHGKYKQAHNLHFQFISREEFNKIKSESPEKVVGEYFTLAS